MIKAVASWSTGDNVKDSFVESMPKLINCHCVHRIGVRGKFKALMWPRKQIYDFLILLVEVCSSLNYTSTRKALQICTENLYL